MKYLYLLIVCNIFSFGTTFSQVSKETKFLVSGEIEGRKTGRLILYYLDKCQKANIDTAEVKDGKFSFGIAISEPTIAYLIGNITTNLMDDPNRTIVFLEQNDMNVHLIEGQFSKVVVKGSKTQADYEKLNANQLPYKNKRQSILKSMDSVRKLININGSADSLKTRLSLLESDWRKNSNNLVEEQFRFISQNPNSVISPFLMTTLIERRSLSVDSAAKILASLSPVVRSSTIGKKTQSIIDQKRKIIVGNESPKFHFKDGHGGTISSEKYIGKKYILLDFWASYCSPCHDQTPYLNKLYDKYKQKGLEIIGISADQSREKWKNSISKNNIERWPQLLKSDDLLSQKGEKIFEKFSIGAIPVLLLVDEAGIIQYRGDGFGGAKQFSDIEEVLLKHLK